MLGVEFELVPELVVHTEVRTLSTDTRDTGRSFETRLTGRLSAWCWRTAGDIGVGGGGDEVPPSEYKEEIESPIGGGRCIPRPLSEVRDEPEGRIMGGGGGIVPHKSLSRSSRAESRSSFC